MWGRGSRRLPFSPFVLVALLGALLYLNQGYTLQSREPEEATMVVEGPLVASPHKVEEATYLSAAREQLEKLRRDLDEVNEERTEIQAVQDSSADALRELQGAIKGVQGKIDAVNKQVAGGGAAAKQVVAPSAGDDGTAGIDFKGTAVVTMAAGNDAARGTIALVQSLRDTQTRAETILVMLPQGGMGSPECHDHAWKVAQKREGVRCSSSETIAEEIISPKYVQALLKMGAKVQVIPEIPSTVYTEGIPGGRGTFWGMALNKLRVFNLTEYKKVLWMDGDTLVLKNIDHLFLKPMFTAAFTYACCNQNGPAIISGGLWVLEPSLKLGTKIWQMMAEGKPMVDQSKNVLVYGDDGVVKREYWHWGDMQIVRWLFSEWRWNKPGDREILWPRIDDARHGHVPGLRFYPKIKNAADPAKALSDAARDSWTGAPLQEGFIPGSYNGTEPIWYALDARYDQCVGHCECLPDRDMPEEFFSVHFSCIQGYHKPSGYSTEKELGETMYNKALGCTRWAYWHKWYAAYKRGFGRLDEPYYEGPEIPGYDAAADARVTANKLLKLR